MDVTQTIGLIHSISALISLTIALIALRGYARFKSWRLFFISTSFFLLSVPLVIGLFDFIGLFDYTSSWNVSILEYLAFIFTITAFVAFGLLALIYLDQQRKKFISFSKTQIIVGFVLIIFQIMLSLWISSRVNFSVYWGYNDITYQILLCSR